jgi:hypothetical protein
MNTHESHRMITLAVNHAHEECYACGACTCHLIERLVIPCEGKFR